MEANLDWFGNRRKLTIAEAITRKSLPLKGLRLHLLLRRLVLLLRASIA